MVAGAYHASIGAWSLPNSSGMRPAKLGLLKVLQAVAAYRLPIVASWAAEDRRSIDVLQIAFGCCCEPSSALHASRVDAGDLDQGSIFVPDSLN